jgi:hypothetical protein
MISGTAPSSVPVRPTTGSDGPSASSRSPAYDYWKRTHAAHHGGARNLSRRGLGDIKTLTVDEFFCLDWRGRLTYWFYRRPLVMFGVGPSYLLLLQHRAPLSLIAAPVGIRGFRRCLPMPEARSSSPS